MSIVVVEKPKSNERFEIEILLDRLAELEPRHVEKVAKSTYNLLPLGVDFDSRTADPHSLIYLSGEICARKGLTLDIRYGSAIFVKVSGGLGRAYGARNSGILWSMSLNALVGYIETFELGRQWKS